jgi:hypothetical protein
MTKNFDKFCYRFLFESINDDEYLRLASDPEKNQEELQRMVDDAAMAAEFNVGPVWHGSWKGNYKSLKPSSHGKVGRGIYFTNTKKVAEFHAKGRDGDWGKNILYKVYLKGNFLETGVKHRPGYLMGANIKLPNEVVSKLNEAGIKSYQAGRKPSDRDLPVYDNTSLKRVFNPGGWQSDDSEKISEIIELLGYSGIILYDDNNDIEYVVFSSNQIKSSDPVTYDDNGNIIPLSQRFDSSKDDIRY